MDIQTKILQTIEQAVSNKEGNKIFIDYAKIKANLIKELKTLTGLDFNGYVHSLDAAGINHALKHANKVCKE